MVEIGRLRGGMGLDVEQALEIGKLRRGLAEKLLGMPPSVHGSRPDGDRQ